MHRSPETIRLTVGLAHTVPGAELTVRRPDGGLVLVANRPDSDLDLCSLRRTLLVDPCLGITAVGVTGPPVTGGGTAGGQSASEARLDELAGRANAACLVEELIWTVRAAAPTSADRARPDRGVGADDENKGDRS
jgi:hypothetical protein